MRVLMQMLMLVLVLMQMLYLRRWLRYRVGP